MRLVVCVQAFLLLQARGWHTRPGRRNGIVFSCLNQLNMEFRRATGGVRHRSESCHPASYAWDRPSVCWQFVELGGVRWQSLRIHMVLLQGRA
jgi:hypothetical protein